MAPGAGAPPVGLAMLLATLLVSGCAGGAAQPLATPGGTQAAAPTADAATGSITGTVASDDLQPISGATVGLLERSAIVTTTDADGRFTFNALEPATYTVVSEKLGFEQAARRIDVRPGEVSYTNFTLKALVVAPEAFTFAISKVAQIHVDNVWATWYVREFVNSSSLNSLRCDPCEFTLYITPRPKQVLSEPTWPSDPNPAVNKEITIYYTKAQGGNNHGTIIYSGYQRDRSAYLFTDAQIQSLGKDDRMRLYIYGAGFTGVSVEQKVTSWSSFAYGSEFPEDYTALPPG